MTRQLVQQTKILAESMCKSMVPVENELQYASQLLLNVSEEMYWWVMTMAVDEEIYSACL